jgi:phage tail tape-measure protein
MDEPEIEIVLTPAGEEQNEENRKRLQEELNTIGSDRFASGIGAALGVVIGGSVGATLGLLIGAAVSGVSLLQVMATVGPALGTALGAWLQAKVGRKVRVKLPDGSEAEARTAKELEKLLDLIKDFQERRARVILEP